MRAVRLSQGRPRFRGRTLYHDHRSWLVLPGCVHPFMAELRATESCRTAADLLHRRPRLIRLLHLWPLYRLRRNSLRRRLGHKRARRAALAFIIAIFRRPKTTKAEDSRHRPSTELVS